MYCLYRSLIIFTLYWKVGKDLTSANVNNISAVLFMWVCLPAFGAASYVPAIVLERPLFVRQASPASCHGCCGCLARNYVVPQSVDVADILPRLSVPRAGSATTACTASSPTSSPRLWRNWASPC
jgi:hypothetical protein